MLNGKLEKILPNDFKGYLDQRFPDWRTGIHRAEARTRAWLNQLSSEIIKLTLMAVAVCLLYIAGLYFLSGCWDLFKNTMIGIRYATNVDRAGAAEISRILALDIKYLGMTIMVLSLYVSLIVGIISQMAMLRRFFYVGRSSVVKLAWGGIVGAAVGYKLVNYYSMSFNLAFGLCFLPTLAILSPVLASFGRLLPELNLSLFVQNYRERKEIQNLKDDIAQLMDEESVEDFE
jgi:hypothetical protein